MEFSWVTGERNFVRLLIKSHFFKGKIKTPKKKIMDFVFRQLLHLRLRGVPRDIVPGCVRGRRMFLGYLPCLRMPCCVGTEGDASAPPAPLSSGLQHRGEPAPSCSHLVPFPRVPQPPRPAPLVLGAARPSPWGWFLAGGAASSPSSRVRQRTRSPSLPRLPLRGRGRAASQK